MSRRKSRLLLPAVLLAAPLAVSGTSAAARRPWDEGADSSLLRQVIPAPTGQNGYEELVLAAEALASSKQYQKAEQLEAERKLTLSMKRYVLLDPPVVRALTLLRRGLAKPVFSPRQALTFSTALPEFSQFRRLARLLALQQYVFLADGRVMDALANARLGLRFGRAIQTDTMISGLVGVAISTLCIRSLGDHLDQLSARDCQALYQVCLEWLAQPNPQIRVMLAERRCLEQSLTDLREEAKRNGPLAAARLLGIDEGQRESFRGVLPASPEEIDRVVTEAAKRMGAQFERVLDELRKPAWERRPVEIPAETDLAGRLLALVLPAYHRIGDVYTSETARIRLLACHAAIRRYRWERNELPPSLAVLSLGDLAVDPFTGQPLQYQLQGTRYRLTSAGPVADPDDLRAIDGRRPVSVTPDDF